MKRALPALAVLLLAPWVGEFLLGNISVRQLPALLILALLYGVRGAVDPGGGRDAAAAPKLVTNHTKTAKIRVACDHFPTGCSKRIRPSAQRNTGTAS